MDERRVTTPYAVVLEDDAAQLRLLKLLLTLEGFAVVTASNGLDGVNEAVQTQPDVVILDLDLPGIDGRTALRRMRALGVGAPVVIVSAYGARRAQRELAAEAAFEKPFEPDELMKVVVDLATGAK
jgi:DNA-binding response OmpR family regulator